MKKLFFYGVLGLGLGDTYILREISTSGSFTMGGTSQTLRSKDL
jgi:hypothetical protein